MRTLGVPNVADRVAQSAAAMLLEEKLRADLPPRQLWLSAQGAVPMTHWPWPGRRCWEKNWVIDLDISAFFDSVPHDLLLKAVAHHTDERWVLLYIERWLKAPMSMPDGTLVSREKGTPQGSPMTPRTQWATSSSRSHCPMSDARSPGGSPPLMMTLTVVCKCHAGWSPRSSRSGCQAGEHRSRVVGRRHDGDRRYGVVGAPAPVVRTPSEALRGTGSGRGCDGSGRTQGRLHREAAGGVGPAGATGGENDGSEHLGPGRPGAGRVLGPSGPWLNATSSSSPSSTGSDHARLPTPTGSWSPNVGDV